MPNPYHLEVSGETMNQPANMPASNKIETFLAWGPFLYPLVFLTAFFGTWLLAFAEIGAMPKPNINDPKSLDYLRHTYALEITLVLLAGAPGAAVAGLMAQFLVFRRSLKRRMLFACLLVFTWVACFSILRYEPYDILVWLFD
ncbi:MAG: hypothetical protein ACR2N1_17615 [Rubripirellula sp.]